MVGRPVRTINWSIKERLQQSDWQRYVEMEESQEVVLDVEVTVNNRPLEYFEGNIPLPLLTPIVMLHQNPSDFGRTRHFPETDLRRRPR